MDARAGGGVRAVRDGAFSTMSPLPGPGLDLHGWSSLYGEPTQGGAAAPLTLGCGVEHRWRSDKAPWRGLAVLEGDVAGRARADGVDRLDRAVAAGDEDQSRRAILTWGSSNTSTTAFTRGSRTLTLFGIIATQDVTLVSYVSCVRDNVDSARSIPFCKRASDELVERGSSPSAAGPRLR
jgi:hypothetical protein